MATMAAPGSSAPGSAAPGAAPLGGAGGELSERRASAGGAPEELERLLGDFRRLHCEISEDRQEVRALRAETRALRQGQAGPRGTPGTQPPLGAAARAGEAPADAPRAVAPRAGSAAREGEHGVELPKRPLLAEVVSRAQKQNLLESVRERRGTSSRKSNALRTPGAFFRAFMDRRSMVTSGRIFTPDEMDLMNCITMVVSFLSLVFFGISIDHETSPAAWFVVEGITIIYFVTETFIKIWYSQQRGGFFCRKDGGSAWNWIDAIITAVQVVEFFVVLAVVPHDQVSSWAKISLYVRGIRIINSLQEASIMRLPVFKHLTRMLIGFVWGLPSLGWVFIIMWLVTAIIAMGLRVLVKADGPDDDTPAKLLGQEVCGTVGECMFTVFRCILGECSDTEGAPLVPIMSQYYGLTFNLTYLIVMVLMVLGIFNVVTAVFVDSITSGIQEEERRYNAKYIWTGDAVLNGLAKFCRFIEQSQEPAVNPHGTETPFHKMTWTAKQLTSLFADPVAARELKQLDIDVDDYVGVDDDCQTSTFTLNQYNRYRLIDIFGIKEDGKVNAEEMLSTIARLQGQAHMNLDKLNMLTIQEVQRSLKDIQDVLTAPPRGPEPPAAPAAAPQAGPEGAPGTGTTLRPAPLASVIGAASGKAGDRATAAPEAGGDEAKAATASTAWASAPSVESEKSRAATEPAAPVERGRNRRRAPARQGAEIHSKPRGER